MAASILAKGGGEDEDPACVAHPPASLVHHDPPLLTRSADGHNVQQRAALGAVEQFSQSNDVLNAVLPAREWSEESGTWMQSVSATPASRADVIELQERLDARLGELQARPGGICPVREELSSQAFDELVRQVTIECPERGLVLLRVRDEIRMTIAAYQTLFKTSVGFGVRKAVQAEARAEAAEEHVEALRAGNQRLRTAVMELAKRNEALQAKYDAEHEERQRKNKEACDFLRTQNTNLRGFLSSRSGGESVV